MFAGPTLLTAHEGRSGSFVRWLEELGLAEFLKDYSLAQLVEWGWVEPQYRVCFPKRFFECWDSYPCATWNPPEDLNPYVLLWDYWWDIDTDDQELWFLDPAFNPNEEIGILLGKNVYKHDSATIPEEISHNRVQKITPYVDYFYRWQGYALIDVLRHADNIMPIYTTPDIVERAQGIIRIAERIKADRIDWPKGILSSPNRWGGLSKVMTWLDHFKAFQDALQSQYKEENKTHELYLKGAKELANHLGVTADMLANGIKNHMLVLADEWMFTNSRCGKNCIWTMRALPYFRAEIQRAMSWLIVISGKTFHDYDTEWRLPFMGNWGWIPLDEALPYESIRHQKKFISLAPHYLKPYNEGASKTKRYDEDRLGPLVRRLAHSNYPFGSFLSSFHEMHDHLSYRPFDKHGPDFRSLRPLDHFASLAIHAEGCLRRELDSLKLLEDIPGSQQGLARYINTLAHVRKIPSRVVGCFSSNHKMADLRKERDDPIGRIEALTTKLPDKEHQLAQAFLSCLLARNYFAHHDFLDNELLYTKKSEFMLKGILLTLLVLLDS